MKPKKVKRILSQFEHYLKGQNSFGIGLNENQRNNFIKYAKRVLDKENKKVSPNLDIEALKGFTEPTFTQPKEVGCNALYNRLPRIERIRKKDIDFTLYYYSNNKVDVSFTKKDTSCTYIDIDNGFIVNSVDVLNVKRQKWANWFQNGNRLFVY